MKGDADKPDKPELVISPPWQAILPAFKKELNFPKKDYRPWRNQHGEQIDSPRYRGPQFNDKIIPPLTDSHGIPFKEDSLQIVRDARGVYRIVDWSLPADKTIAPVNEDTELQTHPIMGRAIYETRHSLERAKLAMSILARKRRDKKAGLPDDPVQCKDLKGAAIFIGRFVLARYARGKFAGHYAIIDTASDIAAPAYRYVLKKDASLKDAVLQLEKAHKTRKPAAAQKSRKKFIAAGAPIAFNAPEGFGGFGGGGGGDRECPTPDSVSWDVTVDLYARTGRWCKTAMLIWVGDYPAELVEQCENYRAEFLEDPSKFYDNPIETTNDDYREMVESHEAARAILEYFEGSCVIDPT